MLRHEWAKEVNGTFQSHCIPWTDWFRIAMPSSRYICIFSDMVDHVPLLFGQSAVNVCYLFSFKIYRCFSVIRCWNFKMHWPASCSCTAVSGQWAQLDHALNNTSHIFCIIQIGYWLLSLSFTHWVLCQPPLKVYLEHVIYCDNFSYVFLLNSTVYLSDFKTKFQAIL